MTPNNARVIGVVKWFDKRRAYGFITIDDTSHRLADHGGDVFVHFSAIQATGYKFLVAGEVVAFTYSTRDGPITEKDVSKQRPMFDDCPVALKVWRSTEAERLAADEAFERETAKRMIRGKA